MLSISRSSALAAALLALCTFSPGAGAQDAMRSIGTLTYTPEPIPEQRGIFNLRPENAIIRSLRIEAADGSADIRELRLVYRSGDVERIRMGDRLRPGTMTAAVLTADPSPIQRIEVMFIPRGPVTLVLRAETRRPEPPPARWESLGCKNVGFLADRDVLNVDTSERYRALRLRSSGFDIQMNEMAVNYVNGQRDAYRLGVTIPSGGFTSPIDLRGESRRIRRIELLYSTNTLSNRKTQLCVEGLKARDQLEEE
jgi:hypothetical protein